MNSSTDKDKGFSTDNAEVADKSPSDKDNVAMPSAAIQELEISNHSYEDLSLEFQKLYPYAVRAFKLIPLMYDRLTLVDKLSHKEASTKICDDHRHLSGFSKRNIRRYWPSNNPITPRRVRPSCPKNSFSKIKEPSELSIAQRESISSAKTDGDLSQRNNYGGEEKTAAAANPQLQEESEEQGDIINKIVEAEADLKLKALVSECNDKLREEAVKRQTAIKTADQVSATEIELTIPNDKYQQVKAAMDNSANSVYVTFDKNGILEHAEPDTFREKLDNA
jgi:hypothetical protein